MRWKLTLALMSLAKLSLAGESYDQGYWTPSTSSTVYWTPSTTQYYQQPTTTEYYQQPTTTEYYQQPTTSCYTSYYTPTSTWVTVYTQNEVIVTYTSYIPCPETSTVIYYTQTCQQCCNDCNTVPAQPTEPYPGTTTFTSYTTTTPGPVQTITSNGYVVVVMDTSTYQSVQPTVSVQYQVISEGLRQGPALWVFNFCIALMTSLMIAF